MMDAEEDEACTICLEPLSHTVPKLHTDNQSENNLYIATLSGCQHVYHHICIEEWAERTNTCPSCRTKFQKLTIRQYLDGPIVNEIGVDDRIQPANHPESSNPDLDIQPEDFIVFETEGSYGNCVICQGGDRGHELLICDGCDRTFHVTCLGIGIVPGGDWYCPSCELDNDYGYRSSHLGAGRAANRSSHRGGRSISRRGRSRRGGSASRVGFGLFQSADSRLAALRTRRRINWPTTGPLIVTPPHSRPSHQPPHACINRQNCEHNQPRDTISFNPEEVEAWNMLEQALVESRHETDHSIPVTSDSNSASTSTSASAAATSSAASSSTISSGPPASIHSVASSSSSSSNSSVKKLKLPTRSARQVNQYPSHNNDCTSRSTPVKHPNNSHGNEGTAEHSASSPATPMRVSNLLSHIRTPTQSHQGNGAVSKPTLTVKPANTSYERKDSAVAESSSCSPSPPPSSTSDLEFSKKEQVQSMVKDILRPIYRAGKIDKHQYTEVCRKASRGLYEVVKQQENTNSDTPNDSRIVPVETVGRYVHIELQDGFGLKLLS